MFLARQERVGCPAVSGLVRIVWFFGQFRSLVRPEGRAWLMALGCSRGFATSIKQGCEESPRLLPVALIEYEVIDIKLT